MRLRNAMPSAKQALQLREAFPCKELIPIRHDVIRHTVQFYDVLEQQSRTALSCKRLLSGYQVHKFGEPIYHHHQHVIASSTHRQACHKIDLNTAPWRLRHRHGLPKSGTSAMAGFVPLATATLLDKVLNMLTHRHEPMLPSKPGPLAIIGGIHTQLATPPALRAPPG